EWEKLARVGQPIIVYMPMANLPDIMSAFERGGMARDTPAVVLSDSTTSEEGIIETPLGMAVADAAREGIGSPAIVIVGAIASMRQQLLANMVGRARSPPPGPPGI